MCASVKSTGGIVRRESKGRWKNRRQGKAQEPQCRAHHRSMELEALSLIKSVTSPTPPQPSTTPSLFHSQLNPTKPPSSFFLFPPVHPPFKTIHTNPSSFSLFPSSYTLPLLPPSTAMNLSSPFLVGRLQKPQLKSRLLYRSWVFSYHL